jgi:ankyrin repeat protein
MEGLHQINDIIAQRYRILDILGQGGVGITYKAQDLKSGQQIALKALSLRQMGDWKILELFEREAKILSQLNHPAIPRYLDYFQVDTPEDRSYYIAQEVAQGKSLADLVEIGWRTNESGVRRIATQILEILVYLHSLKPPVVHRDIKPQNLIWGQNAKVFLVDFGAVQDTYRSTLAKGSTIVGTYGYMAPEQFLGQAVPATDLYGLGATILFLLTHRSPSDLPQERLKISFCSRIQVSDGFADWLEKMLEPDVDDRFSSAKQALEALQGRKVIAKSKLRWSVSWKALTGVGVAAVAAITVLNSYMWAILNSLGVQPSGICSAIFLGGRSVRGDIVLFSRGDIAPFKNYLNQGGNPYAYVTDKLPGDKYPLALLDCALESGRREDIAELMIARSVDFKPRDNQSTTLLHLVVTLRRKDIAKSLISRGADVNAKDRWGKTPLHYVRSKEVAELLIAKGADVKARDKYGETPLHSVDSQEVAELLIAKGADVKARDKYGETPLHSVDSQEVAELLIAKGADVKARNNNGNIPLHSVHSKEVAELLIAKGADINARNNDGQTPLLFVLDHCVGQGCDEEMAKLLIAKGADVKARNKYGETPLHCVDSQEVAKLLIAKGADVNARNNNGQTPLYSTNSKEVADLLIVQGADLNARDKYRRETPLHSVRSKEVAQLLIAKGADLNSRNSDGETPLHLMLERMGNDNVFNSRNKDIVELLIAKGADIEARDNYNQTPLHSAVSRGNKDMVELLIAKGADINAEGAFTPLSLAVKRTNKDMVELLIAKGADINAKGRWTPLYWAVERSNKDLVKLLIAKGANVNIKDNMARTLLHAAVERNHREIIKLLIAKGADVNAKDREGRTPLHFTKSKNVAKLLLSEGAQVNTEDKKGSTPLDYAIRSEHWDVCGLLKSHGGITRSN